MLQHYGCTRVCLHCDSAHFLESQSQPGVQQYEPVGRFSNLPQLRGRSRTRYFLIDCNYHCARPYRSCQWDKHSVYQVPPSGYQRDMQLNDSEDGYPSGRLLLSEPRSQLNKLQQLNTGRIILCEGSWRYQHLFRLWGYQSD